MRQQNRTMLALSQYTYKKIITECQKGASQNVSCHNNRVHIYQNVKKGHLRMKVVTTE